MKHTLTELCRIVAVALGCAIFGAGVGFVQGGIVARGADKIYQVTFAGGAAMIGGVIAFFLGPILFYGLNRRITFERFCYIGVLSSVAGCLVGWILSLRPGDLGWASMFATPIAAVILAVVFGPERSSKNTRTPG